MHSAYSTRKLNEAGPGRPALPHKRPTRPATAPPTKRFLGIGIPSTGAQPMFRSKLRLYTIFVAVCALLAGVAPYAARAQSGDALAHAERTCLDQGIGPHSVTFDACTERAASAYDRGAPEL